MLEATRRTASPAAGELTDPAVAEPWRAAALAWFTEQLARPATFAAFVVDDPADGVVAVAVGAVESRPPGPGAPSGLRGRLFNVATAPDHRRRGHARACVVAVLRWLDEEVGTEAVELSATAEADGLYRSLGFVEAAHPTLRRRAPGR